MADAKGRAKEWSRRAGMMFFELFALLGLLIGGALGVWSRAQQGPARMRAQLAALPSATF